MSKDRSYYRSMESSELIEEATRGVGVDWQELSIVLAERLERAEDAPTRPCPYCDD